MLEGHYSCNMATNHLCNYFRPTFICKISLFLILTFNNVAPFEYFQPEQIHLSYQNDPTQMTVTWSTLNNTNSSLVKYGMKSIGKIAVGGRTEFIDSGNETRKQYIHRVNLIDLIPGEIYWYHCGSELAWSELFFFKALKNGTNWSPKFILYGDMGNENAQTLPWLQNEAQELKVDMILHIGDFAYDMEMDNARVGDQFMRQIQPVAGYVPYMTCVGNHEQAYNFSNYKNRFSMPGSENNMMYSFDVGPIHFIAVSTEYYFFLQYGIKQIVKQYNWLEADLQEANKPENRQARPWIILFGHRPMYCSNNDGDDCTHINSWVRIGIPVLNWYGLEPLLYKYGVDLALWAHEHSYERLWPVYNRKVFNGSYDAPYVDPKATVHVTTGSAGNIERHDEFQEIAPEWTAFRSTDYGYSRMTVHNESHLYLEQMSSDKNGDIIDSFWIERTYHGSFKTPWKKWKKLTSKPKAKYY